MTKIRLDELLIQHQLAPDLTKARAMIGAGEVFINDEIADKPGQKYSLQSKLRVKQRCRYVSRGGLKLERALHHFQLDPSGLCCLDVGASSGGFSDCLLQHGARKVFAVDVAYGQLDWKIRQDERVIVIERFNARKLQPHHLAEAIDLGVMDASFISITKLLPALPSLFRAQQKILALIKPQFELPKEQIPAGGVVTDPVLHLAAQQKIKTFAATLDLVCQGIVTSPILGPKGNKEFIIYLTSR